MIYLTSDIFRKLDEKIEELQKNINFGVTGKISFVIFSRNFPKNIHEYKEHNIILNPVEKSDIVGSNIYCVITDSSVDTNNDFMSDLEKRIVSRFSGT